MNNTVESHVEFTPTAHDDGATLSCIATNVLLAPSQGSKADVISLNVSCKYIFAYQVTHSILKVIITPSKNIQIKLFSAISSYKEN